MFPEQNREVPEIIRLVAVLPGQHRGLLIHVGLEKIPVLQHKVADVRKLPYQQGSNKQAHLRVPIRPAIANHGPIAGLPIMSRQVPVRVPKELP